MVEPQPIAIVRGASSRQVEDTFRALVDLWQPTIRLAGVVAEGHGLPDRFCNAGFLRNLTTQERFPIFRDLGPNTDMCHLEGTDALAAAEAVKQDISAGCDLVLLSKFGQLETEGKGLTGAFAAAIDKTIPLVTSVSPAFDKAWRDFASRPFAILPADVTVIDAWQRSVRRAAATTHPVA